MTRRHAHRIAVAGLLAAIAGIALAIVGLTGGLSPHQAQQQAARTLLRTAVQADTAAANTGSSATTACNPATGAAKAGTCAPVSGPSAQLAHAAGDPFHIGGVIGVDISSYQDCPHRLAVAFVIAKATESTGYTDRCLGPNVRAAKAQHLVYGTYDFLRPSYQHTATAEAAHYVAAVRAAGAGAGIKVADVEANAGLSPGAVHSYVCNWVGYVRRALGGTVAIYTGNWFWAPQVAGGNCGAPLWISAYAPTAYVPRAWGGGLFPYGRFDRNRPLWQFSDGHYGPTPHVNGWDTDYFNGTLAQLRAFAQAKPPARPASARANRDCRELLRLRRVRAHHKHPTRALVSHASAGRRALVKHGYRCDARTRKAVRK